MFHEENREALGYFLTFLDFPRVEIFHKPTDHMTDGGKWNFDFDKDEEAVKLLVHNVEQL